MAAVIRGGKIAYFENWKIDEFGGQYTTPALQRVLSLIIEVTFFLST